MDGDVVVLLFRDTADAGTPLASGKEGMTVSPLNLPFLFLVSIRNTTGNRDFVECKILCRVSKIGHSAKIFFAECYTRQRIALGNALGKHGHSAKDFFAECQTLGKISPLGIGCLRNGALPRPSLPSACG